MCVCEKKILQFFYFLQKYEKGRETIGAKIFRQFATTSMRKEKSMHALGEKSVDGYK